MNRGVLGLQYFGGQNKSQAWILSAKQHRSERHGGTIDWTSQRAHPNVRDMLKEAAGKMEEGTWSVFVENHKETTQMHAGCERKRGGRVQSRHMCKYGIDQQENGEIMCLSACPSVCDCNLIITSISTHIMFNCIVETKYWLYYEISASPLAPACPNTEAKVNFIHFLIVPAW